MDKELFNKDLVTAMRSGPKLYEIALMTGGESGKGDVLALCAAIAFAIFEREQDTPEDLEKFTELFSGTIREMAVAYKETFGRAVGSSPNLKRATFVRALMGYNN